MNVRFSIIDLLVFTTIAAIQFRSQRGMEIGFAVTFFVVLMSIVAKILTAMANKSRQNSGAELKTHFTKLINTVLCWSFVNLLLLSCIGLFIEFD